MQTPINIRTLNAIIGRSWKNVKQESNAFQGDTNSSSHSINEKLDNIMTFVQDINTKLSSLTSIMHFQHTRFDTKFTSLQTQLDQITKEVRRRWWLAIPWKKKREMVFMIEGKQWWGERELNQRGSNARARKANCNKPFHFLILMLLLVCFHIS